MRDITSISSLRIAAFVLLLVLFVPLLSGYVTSPASVENVDTDFHNVTVVTIDATGPSQIVAYRTDGSVLYQNRSYQVYHDVDPSPAGDATVTYIASNGQLPASRCDSDQGCMYQAIERVNLSTGEITTVYDWYTTNKGSTQIHDVDRVNETTWLVGNIAYPDSVYMVNTTTGERIWEWGVHEAFEPSSGGRYPNDWTHLNDVAILDDGRVMANLRNQDQVVFIEPGSGLLQNWTLGSDGDHEILYEPHNPDYIPAEQGGPAVLIADSENDRIVEYQRVNGSWIRSWEWSDPTLSWPRDADRLPNGNTLIVDSHGQRLLEVNPNGTIVWKQAFPNGGYDVERLGTGDESTNGTSVSALRNEGYRFDARRNCVGLLGCLGESLTDLVPSLVLHGVLFVLPDWVTPIGGVAVLLQGLIVVTWVVVELGVRRERIRDAVKRRL